MVGSPIFFVLNNMPSRFLSPMILSEKEEEKLNPAFSKMFSAESSKYSP